LSKNRELEICIAFGQLTKLDKALAALTPETARRVKRIVNRYLRACEDYSVSPDNLHRVYLEGIEMERGTELSFTEADFTAEHDSFYLATVGENGYRMCNFAAGRNVQALITAPGEADFPSRAMTYRYWGQSGRRARTYCCVRQRDEPMKPIPCSGGIPRHHPRWSRKANSRPKFVVNER
jgi:hypothetical protein